MKTPLEMAMSISKKKTCVECSERTIVNGVNYCKADGKILYPMLLEKPYAECPNDIRRRKTNENH